MSKITNIMSHNLLVSHKLLNYRLQINNFLGHIILWLQIIFSLVTYCLLVTN